MTIKKQQGVAIWAIVVTIVVLAVIGVIIAAGSSGGGDNNSGGDSAGNGVCHTYCLGLVQLECGSNKAVGACIGAWDCSPPDKGAHQCKSSDGY